jgi:ribosomal protein S18 acetylase RimI-like enzyme
MKIKIRKVKPTDAEQFVRLKTYVWKSTYSHMFPPEVFDENDAQVEERVKSFKTRKDRNKNGNLDLVAVNEDTIVGFIVGSTTSNYEYFAQKGFGELCSIYIHPDFQGFGIGKRFFNMLIEHLRKHDCKNMVISCLDENHNAHIAYEKWGGKLYTKHKSSYKRLGKSYARRFYVFDL